MSRPRWVQRAGRDHEQRQVQPQRDLGGRCRRAVAAADPEHLAIAGGRLERGGQIAGIVHLGHARRRQALAQRVEVGRGQR